MLHVRQLCSLICNKPSSCLLLMLPVGPLPAFVIFNDKMTMVLSLMRNTMMLMVFICHLVMVTMMAISAVMVFICEQWWWRWFSAVMVFICHSNQRLPDPVLVTHSALLSHYSTYTAVHTLTHWHTAHSHYILLTAHSTQQTAHCYWFQWNASHCPHCTVLLPLTLHFALLLLQQCIDFTRQTTLCPAISTFSAMFCNILHLCCFAVKPSSRVFRWIISRCWTCWKHSAVATD